MNLDDGVVTETISRCCRAKADIVSADERESGTRALLNLGHSFGHAYEAASGYDGTILHGEAVAVGMMDAFKLSCKLGYTDFDTLARVRTHLLHAQLPIHRSMLSTTLRNTHAKTLLAHMQKDKKNLKGAMILIIPHGIGDARIDRNISQQTVTTTLEEPYEGGIT